MVIFITINKILQFIRTKKFSNEIKIIFLICLFSSLALYIRPYLVFFPIFVVLKSLILKDVTLLKFSVLFYLLFSIPGLQLIYIWEGIFKIGNNEINLIQDFHNPKFILKNLVIFASLFFFYSLPFQLMRKLNYTKKSLIYFFVIFSALIIMNYLNIFEYLNSIKFGGGVFLKINNFLFNGNLIFFLTISSLGILTIYNYFILSKKNKILLICLIVFCFPKYILQEYFEPLILVILFTLIDLGTKNLKIFHQKKVLFIFCIYFTTYYFGSFYYRYFLFPIN